MELSELPESWLALDEKLKALYGDQEPMLWKPGIRAYRCTDPAGTHFHYVTYGLSAEFGFELTFRLRPFAPDGPDAPEWACTILQEIGRFVNTSKNRLDTYHWIGGKRCIRPETSSEIVTLMFITDPVLGVLPTHKGSIQCLQAVGLTATEIAAVKDKRTKPAALLAQLQHDSPLLITDLTRA